MSKLTVYLSNEKGISAEELSSYKEHVVGFTQEIGGFKANEIDYTSNIFGFYFYNRINTIIVINTDNPHGIGKKLIGNYGGWYTIDGGIVEDIKLPKNSVYTFYKRNGEDVVRMYEILKRTPEQYKIEEFIVSMLGMILFVERVGKKTCVTTVALGHGRGVASCFMDNNGKSLVKSTITARSNTGLVKMKEDMLAHASFMHKLGYEKTAIFINEFGKNI